MPRYASLPRGSAASSASPQALSPSSSTSAPPAATKRIARRPRPHETPGFLAREAAVPSALEVPWHLGAGAAECQRLAATLHRAATTAAKDVGAVSWGYGACDGPLGHNDTAVTVPRMKRIATFRRLRGLRQVAAGTRLSVFLTDTGDVYESGRLFLGQDGWRMWGPRVVPFDSTAAAAVEDDDRGDADTGTVHTTPPSASSSTRSSTIRIVAVAAGHLAAYALDDHGRVYSWGTRRYGQLGHGDDDGDGGSDLVVPVSPVDDNQRVRDDEDEDDGSAPLSQDDPPHSNDNNGRNHHDSNDDDGDDDEKDETTPNDGDQVDAVVVVLRAPTRIDAPCLRGARVVKLSAGNHFAVALCDLGRAYSWGWNGHGQLGQGPGPRGRPAPQRSSPAPVVGLEALAVVDVSAGHSHVLAVALPRTTSPSPSPSPSHVLDPVAAYSLVFAWGRGRHGCLGLGGDDDHSTPQEVAFFRGLHATMVAAGHDHSLVACAGGGARAFAYAFGGNAFGQLGVARPMVAHSAMPLLVDELAGMSLAAIGAGAYYSGALTGDGEVYTWGDASHGKTARPDRRTTFAPWPVRGKGDMASGAGPGATNVDDGPQGPLDKPPTTTLLPDDAFVTQLAIGAYHSLALYRKGGRPDRWRKFPLDPIATYLRPGEGESAVVCVCESARAKTPGLFGLVLRCRTCGIGPVCRVCARRCHPRHELVPHAVDDEDAVQENASDSHDRATTETRLRPVPCACGRRRQPPLPSLNPREDRGGVGRVAPAADVATESIHPSADYCKLASVPEVIPEDAVISSPTRRNRGTPGRR